VTRSPVAASPPLPLAARVAVVTGASGGIGGAIALELARGGADVLVHGARRKKQTESVAAEIRALGRQSRTLLADLTDEAATAKFADQAWRWRQGVDIWVNCAGADVLTGAAAKLSFEEKLQKLWAVDVLGTIRLSRLIGERMKTRAPQPGGVILNLGWDQAEQGMAGDSGEMFAAVKGAVMAFTRSLAQSLAPHVRVNCLAPGWIRTAWGERASDYWQERATRQSLRQRWGTPADVARAAAFLVSPAADFITGQVIPINGGFRYD
jgi:3-oxoacyl-[acyl-carrier protein] reductase